MISSWWIQGIGGSNPFLSAKVLRQKTIKCFEKLIKSAIIYNCRLYLLILVTFVTME